MALIVEDGSGLANAESFISEADADLYHENRGNTTWDSVAEKEAMLRRATDYMEQAYRLRWTGMRVTTTQRLSWPRAWVPIPDAPSGYGSVGGYVEQNVVPEQVKAACAELALLASTGDLNPVLDRVTTREVVGEIEVEYQPNSPQYKRYRSVDMLLEPFLGGSPNTMRLTRT